MSWADCALDDPSVNLMAWKLGPAWYSSQAGWLAWAHFRQGYPDNVLDAPVPERLRIYHKGDPRAILFLPTN